MYGDLLKVILLENSRVRFELGLLDVKVFVFIFYVLFSVLLLLFNKKDLYVI